MYKRQVVDLNTVSGKSITKIAEKLCGVEEQKIKQKAEFLFGLSEIFLAGGSPDDF